MKDVLQAGRVVRYHSAPVDKKQSVGEHTWGVMAVLLHIYPQASRRLLINALYHDVAETHTGDIPSPVKKMNPDVKTLFDRLERAVLTDMSIQLPTLNDEEKRYLKIADCLEGMMYCEHRIKAGDQGAIPVRDKYREYLMDLDFNPGSIT